MHPGKPLLFLFDCDDTLWSYVPQSSQREDDAGWGTWISYEQPAGAAHTFVAVSEDEIEREWDKARFKLLPGVREALTFLKAQDAEVYAGIVSDNYPETVDAALQHFKIDGYLDKRLIAVQYWEGPSDKAKMIRDLLQDTEFSHLPADNIILFDDNVTFKDMMKGTARFTHIDGRFPLDRLVKDHLV